MRAQFGTRPLTVTIPATGAITVGVLGWIVGVWIVMVGMGFVAAAGLADLATNSLIIVAQLTGFTLWGGTMVYAGMHTLRGDRTARWLLIGVLSLSALPGLAMVPILPLFLLSAACIGGIVALLLPESRAWFAPPPVKPSPE